MFTDLISFSVHTTMVKYVVVSFDLVKGEDKMLMMT